MKRFLITYTSEFGMQQSYFTNQFNDEDLNTDHQMIVFDLEKDLVKVNNSGWAKIDKGSERHPNYFYV